MQPYSLFHPDACRYVLEWRDTRTGALYIIIRQRRPSGTVPDKYCKQAKPQLFD